MRDKIFDTAKNPKYDEYQRGLASMVYKYFDKKKTSATRANKFAGSGIKNENNSEELYKPIIRKIKEKKSTLTFYRQYLGRR